STFEYEEERDLVEWGVTPILRHDPLGRLIRTDLPDGTCSRMVFDAWRQETWDQNDSIEGTPWLARKQTGSADDQRCATLTRPPPRTPAVAHLDPLGRAFLTVADNAALGRYATRLTLDIEGNQRAIAVESVEPGVSGRNPLTIMTQVFDVLGRTIRT